MAFGPDHEAAAVGRYVVNVADHAEVEGVAVGVAA